MRSINEIDKEITLHENNWAYYKKVKELKKHRERVAFLKTCKYYLESKPTEDFIQKEIAKMVESNSNCREQIGSLREKEQERSLSDIYVNMKVRIKSNNKFLETLYFIQNKTNGQNQGSLL